MALPIATRPKPKGVDNRLKTANQMTGTTPRTLLDRISQRDPNAGPENAVFNVAANPMTQAQAWLPLGGAPQFRQSRNYQFTPQQQQSLAANDALLSRIKGLNADAMQRSQARQQALMARRNQPLTSIPESFEMNPDELDLSLRSRMGAPPGTPEWRKTNISPSGQVSVGPDLGVVPETYGGYQSPLNQRSPMTAVPEERAAMARANAMARAEGRSIGPRMGVSWGNAPSPVASPVSAPAAPVAAAPTSYPPEAYRQSLMPSAGDTSGLRQSKPLSPFEQAMGNTPFQPRQMGPEAGPAMGPGPAAPQNDVREAYLARREAEREYSHALRVQRAQQEGEARRGRIEMRRGGGIGGGGGYDLMGLALRGNPAALQLLETQGQMGLAQAGLGLQQQSLGLQERLGMGALDVDKQKAASAQSLAERGLTLQQQAQAANERLETLKIQGANEIQRLQAEAMRTGSQADLQRVEVAKNQYALEEKRLLQEQALAQQKMTQEQSQFEAEQKSLTERARLGAETDVIAAGGDPSILGTAGQRTGPAAAAPILNRYAPNYAATVAEEVGSITSDRLRTGLLNPLYGDELAATKRAAKYVRDNLLKFQSDPQAKQAFLDLVKQSYDPDNLAFLLKARSEDAAYLRKTLGIQ